RETNCPGIPELFQLADCRPRDGRSAQALWRSKPRLIAPRETRPCQRNPMRRFRQKFPRRHSVSGKYSRAKIANLRLTFLCHARLNLRAGQSNKSGRKGSVVKRSVSLVASLVLAVAVSGCGAVKATKAEFTQVCLKRLGNAQAKCSCYV